MRAPKGSVFTRLVELVRQFALIACLVVGGSATRSTAQSEVSTPPPVSGRRLSNPEMILPADVLARVELLRAKVERLRLHMGKPPPPPPLLLVESAQPFEVYSQAGYLLLRANRLAFEQLRVVRNPSVPRADETQPADVFTVVDSALEAVLMLHRDFGIAEAIAEQPRPDSTTPSEVFNATVAAGGEINHLLDERTSPSDVFQFVTTAVHTAAALHAAIQDGPPFPEEPAFEPNKMPIDVYMRMQRCLSLIRQISGSNGIQMLEFQVAEEAAERVSPNDVGDLASLVVEELARVHRRVPEAQPAISTRYPGRRFPAHVYQRVGLLERILEDLVEASGSPAPSPVSSRSGSDRS